MDNRRTMDRYNLQVNAVMSFPDTPTKLGRTLNISGDGVFIMTRQTMPIGTKVFVSLLAEAKPSEQLRKKTVIRMAGTVRRITSFGMAVCFDPCMNWNLHPNSEPEMAGHAA